MTQNPTMTKSKLGLLAAFAFLALSSLCSYAQNSWSTDLVAYWPFDGAGNDAHLGNHDATFIGATEDYVAVEASYPSAKFGRAALLTFADGEYYLVGGDENAFDSTDGSITISAWFAVESFSTNWQALIAKGEGNCWRIARRSGSQKLGYAGGLADTPELGPDVNDSALHHVVAITDESGALYAQGTHLFIDGVEVASVAGDPALCVSDGNNGLSPMIGNNPQAATRSWNGVIDDVAVWTRPLTSDEIATLYNSGNGTSLASLLGVVDNDGDGLTNDDEINIYGTDPFDPDTDNDTLNDGAEIAKGSNPLVDDDPDADGLLNSEEGAAGTDYCNPDTDADGLTDGDEVNFVMTDPLDPDTDNDALTDGDEVNFVMTDPLDPDTDDDGFQDGGEVSAGTDPLSALSRPGLGGDPGTQTFGLVAYWPLDAYYNDLTATGAHGTLVDDDPSQPNFAPGKFGPGANLVRTPGDGSTFAERIVIDGVPESTFDFTGQSLSISAWFRTAPYNTAWQALVAKGEGNAWRVARRASSDIIAYAGGTGDIPGDNTTGPNVNDGEIHHVVAITEAGVSTRLWVDGALVATGGPPSVGNNDAFMMIGGNPQGGPNNRTWNGVIDDVSIWGRPLIEDEIAILYNGGTGASVRSATGPAFPFAINDTWRPFYYPGSTPVSGPGADLAFGANGLQNLVSFAFGLDPTGLPPGLVQVDLDTNTIINLGSANILLEQPGPEFSVIYARRTDYQDSNLIYTCEFSRDMVSWETGGGTPQVIANGIGANGVPVEVVKVTYPWFLSDGTKAQFFRVVISIIYPQ